MEFSLHNGLALFGLVSILYCTYKVSKVVYRLVNVYVLTSYPDFTKYGKWAVITGSTSGIGKALAHQFASRGLSIVIISLGDVEGVAEEIRIQYGVETKHLLADFSKNDDAIYEDIKAFLKGLDVGVLVNNAGMGNIGRFLEYDDKFINDIMNVNAKAVIKMTQVILPGMLERKRGLIMNMASASAGRPCYGWSMYGATKSLVTYFSDTLRDEYGDQGIDIQTIQPGFVGSNMTAQLKMAPNIITSEEFASSLLTTVGKEQFTHGHWKFDLQIKYMAPLMSDEKWVARWKAFQEIQKKHLKRS